MSFTYDTKERFTLQLVSKVKSYILSFNPKPPIIDPDAFVKHLYYYAFYDYLRKSADKFNLRKNEIFKFILKAIHLAIAEINRHYNLYTLQTGRYYLCV
jgi:hypothetical protein